MNLLLMKGTRLIAPTAFFHFQKTNCRGECWPVPRRWAPALVQRVSRCPFSLQTQLSFWAGKLGWDSHVNATCHGTNRIISPAAVTRRVGDGGSALCVLKTTFKSSSWWAGDPLGPNLRLHEAKTILNACPQFNYKFPNYFLFSPSEGEVNMLFETISG